MKNAKRILEKFCDVWKQDIETTQREVREQWRFTEPY